MDKEYYFFECQRCFFRHYEEKFIEYALRFHPKEDCIMMCPKCESTSIVISKKENLYEERILKSGEIV